MVGPVRTRRLLAGMLMALWLLPAPVLAEGDSDAPPDDDYEYSDDSEDAYDYGIDEADPESDEAATEDATYETNRWQRAGEMAFDLLLLRPAAVGGAVAGFGFFMVSMPFVVFTDQLEVTRDLFMGVPGEYAFQRAIGEI
jgi:hypothetical protein